ncbi:alpha/beta hydrolase [Halomonas sp. 1390]|uniref:alpha/beta hydrolase n=1 Tax=Halomonas sp. B23F22_3 TaxID=3459516 RepID=UPI00373F236A
MMYPNLPSWRIVLGMLTLLPWLTGCNQHATLDLMPTPIIYLDTQLDPFTHLTDAHRSTVAPVFYATNRSPQPGRVAPYGNRIDAGLHLGQADVRMGEEAMTWNELHHASLNNGPVTLSLEGVEELGYQPLDQPLAGAQLSAGQQRFIDAINAQLAMAFDKEIMLYVHGTKVDFFNSVAMTAEIDHFAGRDFVGVAFAWPSHQNILAYLLGIDVSRARASAPALVALIELLAAHTDAEHINLLSYSAGGRVASRALADLQRQHASLSPQALRDRFRLGAVVFAAADVEVDAFLPRLAAISQLANQVVITVSDDDTALKAAERYMGGGARTGALVAEAREQAFIEREHLDNVEIIDVSRGKQARGFDISGHHYWYRHPWASSDVIFLLRTDLPPMHRGLEEAEHETLWFLSADYPSRSLDAVSSALAPIWQPR